MAKGQVELVVIIGIIAVAAVVILYSYSSFSGSQIPAGIKGKYDVLKASVEGLAREGAQDTMRKLSAYGGYLDNSSFQLGSVKFLGKDVPYWQVSGQVKYPNTRENFINGVSDYISLQKEGMLSVMDMSGVELGEPQVNAAFYPSKIILTVSMPTTVDGQRISVPYSVEVDTRFAEVEEFSKGFAQQEASKRPIEYFTLSSMLISPIEGDVHTVPLFIFLTECGDYAFRSWWDVKPEMERTIKETLANTYMPGKAPTGFLMTASAPKYSLIPVNGKRYENLDVNFHLPDEFELTPADFQFTPDPIVAVPEMIPLVGECMSDPVYVKYYLSYPAIVRVKDPLTQNVFQFAIQVYIKDNQPGTWAYAQGYEDVQRQICANPQCSGRISVRTSSGLPIERASVMFMGCNLGRTSSQGVYSGPAPCGLGPLQIYKEGYEGYVQMKSSDYLTGLSVTLAKTPLANVQFYEVVVQNLSLSGKYDISMNGVRALNEDQNVLLGLYGISSGKIYQTGFSSNGGRLSMIPAGDYIISGTLFSKGKELGAFLINYTIREDLEGKNLYIYLPSDPAYGQITDKGEKAVASIILSNVLAKCGLGPISAGQAKGFNGCSVSYGDVQ